MTVESVAVPTGQRDWVSCWESDGSRAQIDLWAFAATVSKEGCER